MCAIIGIIGARKAAERAMLGLHAMQHRAIDYAGIATTDAEHFYEKLGAGVARQIFLKKIDDSGHIELDLLHGASAIGHLRYPTVQDDGDRMNIQPIEARYGDEKFYLAHNGNLTNTDALLRKLEGAELRTNMDSELIAHLLAKEHTGDLLKDLGNVCNYLEGSYSLILMFADRLIAVRDPRGNRPLTVGRINGSTVVASETCALETLEATVKGDVPAGCIHEFSEDGSVREYRFTGPHARKLCIFELVYYSHPTSVTFNTPILGFRERLGEEFERMAPVPGADLVVGVPDSGTAFAVGWGKSGRSGTFHPVIVRNHYVGRTFIASNQTLRDMEVAQKFQFDVSAIAGKRIVLIDDSIVRLTTLPKVVRRLKTNGAKEVHVRIAFPPIKHPCLYGINTPTYEELSAANLTTEEIREKAGADSLVFMDLDMLKGIADGPGYCDACVTGKYWHKAA